MTEQEIRELAAILVQEHGWDALPVAEARRDQHQRNGHAEAFRLWTEIAEAVAEVLERAPIGADGGVS